MKLTVASMGILLCAALTMARAEPGASQTAGSQAAGSPTFAVVDHIAGPDGGWDYATVDQRSGQLFIGRPAGVLAMALQSRHLTPVFVPGKGVHGAFPAGDTGLALSTNGSSNTVTVFEASSGKVLAELPVGKGPDAATFEPKSGLMAVMNHDAGTVSLVDIHARQVTGTVQVGGELEFAQSAGDGRVFVNVANKHQIAVIDVPAKKVQTRFKLNGCEDPSGLAYDSAAQLLASVCANGVTKFLRAADGTEIASLHTGLGSDGLILDTARKLLFVPAGRDGTLTVVSLQGTQPKILQKLTTHRGARLGVLDPATSQIYLPSAQLGPPIPPSPYPSVKPGTVQILVVAAR